MSGCAASKNTTDLAIVAQNSVNAPRRLLLEPSGSNPSTNNIPPPIRPACRSSRGLFDRHPDSLSLRAVLQASCPKVATLGSLARLRHSFEQSSLRARLPRPLRVSTIFLFSLRPKIKALGISTGRPSRIDDSCPESCLVRSKENAWRFPSGRACSGLRSRSVPFGDRFASYASLTRSPTSSPREAPSGPLAPP